MRREKAQCLRLSTLGRRNRHVGFDPQVGRQHFTGLGLYSVSDAIGQETHAAEGRDRNAKREPQNRELAGLPFAPQ